MRTNGLSPEILRADLREAGIDLDPGQADQLARYHDHLRQENPRLNLTRIHSYEAMVRKHYVDSLIILRMLEELPAFRASGSCLDFGSGAGLPGIPLAIALPRWKFILNESRSNRAEFLEECKRICELANVTVLGKRLAQDDGIKVDSVVVRAVGSMRSILLRVAAGMKPGGIAIFLKGPNCDGEIEEMRTLTDNARLLMNKPYVLPESQDRRRLVVYQVENPAALVSIRSGLPEGVEVISSRDNERFKNLVSLNQSKGIKKQGLALVCGSRLVEELLEDESEGTKITALLVNRNYWLVEDVEPVARIPVWTFENELFKEIDVQGTGAPLAVVRVNSLPEFESPVQGLSVVIPFQDPENVGAALRSCLAFGVAEAILTQEAANPFLPRAIRASANACFRIAIKKGPALAEIQLEMADLPVFVLTGDAPVSLTQTELPKDCIVVAGLEGAGVPSTLKGQRVFIEISDEIDSLNAVAALSVSLYEYRRQNQRRRT
ncbi:MAG: 16S rRNA (guanine(527)-N(7))-methyltransferase RsmG [Leptospirales bacterium]|nr:16S rRNA (guanine(527)-N(7))-methyltransferase RsmG [Leptospirales bacterium]